ERKRFYELEFEAKDGSEKFSLYPDVIKNNKGMEGFAANPAAQHYWNRDIFVYISSFLGAANNDTSKFDSRIIKMGDTSFYSSGFF
ncbi:hypothetical protein ABTM81_20015, partial [Acinetobacter baumannii]